MKTENRTPFPVEALAMPDHDGNPALVVIVKATFAFGGGGSAVPAEEQIPIAFGDEPGEPGKGVAVKWESDVVPFKPRADIVLAGKAHAPGGAPAPWVDVTLGVGARIKTLRVFGERKWVCEDGKLTAAMTRPIPFREMELTPERAFGGMDMRTGGNCPENPFGRGYFDHEVVDDPEKAFLPNIEDPKSPIRRWSDRPRPAGFGLVGKGCRPRFGYLGTYDEKWRTERSPRPPVDFRPDFFNAAQPDLQVGGYLQGNEEILLVNLTPGGGEVRFRLPGIRPAAAVTRADIEGSGWDAPRIAEDVEMRLDTLCLLPEESRLFAVWRGLIAIRDLGALEVRDVAVGLAKDGKG